MRTDEMPVVMREIAPVRDADAFQANLRDGRTIEIHRMGAPRGGPGERIGWTATEVGRRQPGYLGLAWFAPIPTTAGHALAEVVINPGQQRSGLALILLDAVVLAAATLGIGSLTLFLPSQAEDFTPVIASFGGRIVSAGGEVLVAELPLDRGPRRYLGSGMHRATRSSEPRGRH